MVGFSAQNLDAVNSMYICPRCAFILRDPVQLIDCGHRLCQSCLDEQQTETIICSECYKTTARIKLKPDRGFKNDMQFLLIICSLCHWAGELKNYPNHLDQTHSNPTCNYCNGNFQSVEDLDRHKRFTCEKISVDCPLKSIGCEGLIFRVDLAKHYLSDQHQQVLAMFACRNRPIASSRMNTVPTDQLTEIDEIVNSLSSGFQILDIDSNRLGSESVHYRSMLQLVPEELSIFQKSTEEQNLMVDTMISQQESLEHDLSPMVEKINDIKRTSYDGTCIWRIDNVKEKRDAAKSNVQLSICSPPFYSSSSGYKMCLRLYPNGDGKARNTHMSLFFVLMRGPFDAILDFPFCFKIIFCLYNLSDGENHLIDSFRPDVRSNSFHRPRSDMNVASGIPTFAPLSLFENESNLYVRDNTMFIKVIVDFDSIPKDIIPFALNLNPGLTIPKQFSITREEIGKRKQISGTREVKSETNQSINMA